MLLVHKAMSELTSPLHSLVLLSRFTKLWKYVVDGEERNENKDFCHAPHQLAVDSAIETNYSVLKFVQKPMNLE